MRKRFKGLILLIIGVTSAVFLAHFAIKAYRAKNFEAAAKKEMSAEEIVEKEYKDKQIKSYVLDKDLKFDFVESTESAKDLPNIRAKNAFTIDITTDKVLFDKNSKEKRVIASLTKIMTAVVALEHKKLDEEIVVSHKAANIGENTMGISEGETYTLEDLMYGLVLHSGNDAAYAIAEGTAGNTDKFIYWMNLKASELGLSDTKFFDPSGLDDNTYSSAYDLAKLTRYALKNPDFKKIVATLDYEIPYAEGKHKYLFLSNQTNLLRTYPGVHGVKTGYTEAANLCLVTYANNNGHEIIGVVLGSDERKIDMIQMLDYSFGKVGVKVDHPLLDF